MRGRVLHVLRSRPWLTVTIAVLVAGIAAGAYLLHSSSGSSTSAAAATSRLISVTSGPVQQSVTATGTLVPADEEDVSFASSAVVTSVRVAVGDHVAKGAVLGTIDTLALRAALAQDQATLATAQANLAAAQSSSTTTSAQLTADEANVSTAQSAVSEDETNLGAATLTSPIDGTVAAVNVTVGQVAGSSGTSGTGGSTGSGSGGAGSGRGSSTGGTGTSSGSGAGTSTRSSAGASTGSGAAASAGGSGSSSADFVVVGGKAWTVSTSVDDTQVGLVAKGDEAQITTGNSTNTIFGTVSSVAVLASTSSGSASYPVTIAVTGSPSGLHDGASATVAIVYRQIADALTVPTLALHTSGSSTYVYLDSGGKRVRQSVTTGVISNGDVQITAGLQAGEQVYVDVPTTRTGPRTTGTGGTSGSTGRVGGGFGRGGGGLGGGGLGGGGFGGGN